MSAIPTPNAAPSSGAASEQIRWWRTRSVHDVGRDEIDHLDRLLGSTAILGERRWDDALDGQVDHAVGVAIRILVRDEIGSLRLDLAMTCLLTIAARGNPTASLVLDHAKRRLAHS
jgi:hypothetical protein